MGVTRSEMAEVKLEPGKSIVEKRVPSNNVAAPIDPSGERVASPWEIKRGERAIAQQEAMVNTGSSRR